MQEMLAITITAIIRSQPGALVNNSSHPSKASEDTHWLNTQPHLEMGQGGDP